MGFVNFCTGLVVDFCYGESESADGFDCFYFHVISPLSLVSPKIWIVNESGSWRWG